LPGTGTVFDRLVCDPLPAVTGGPLISVIMPAWNADKTVRKAAQSILDQTWRNLELLIVDDASTDDTWAVLQEITKSDARVKIFRNKVNAGPYVSKNIALTQCKGEWITGHDSDDWSLPQRLEHQLLKTLALDLDISLVNMVRMSINGNFSFIRAVNNFSCDGVARKSSISCLFRAEILHHQLGFWDSVRFGADSEMIERAKKVISERFGELREMGMICLDLETSLTNHPLHGVRAEIGMSPSRLKYRKSWGNWHKQHLISETAFLPIKQSSRRYEANEGMIVPADTVNYNMIGVTVPNVDIFKI
jgi:glycosyltransferase involved in cell wall biosynthesis